MKRRIKTIFNEAERNAFFAINPPDYSPDGLFGRKLTRSQSNDILWRPVYIVSKGVAYTIPIKLTEPIITYKIEQYV